MSSTIIWNCDKCSIFFETFEGLIAHRASSKSCFDQKCKTRCQQNKKKSNIESLEEDFPIGIIDNNVSTVQELSEVLKNYSGSSSSSSNNYDNFNHSSSPGGAYDNDNNDDNFFDSLQLLASLPLEQNHGFSKEIFEFN